MISPVFDAPLILVEQSMRTLVATDIHLGLEYELFLGGISIPSQTDKILKSMLEYIDLIKPDLLLLLGDVKHNVPRSSWQEKKEVPRFLRSLSQVIDVEVVPGNHDSNLADMAPSGVRLRSSSGHVLDGVGYFHGHAWPDEKVMMADLIIAGHLHPAVRLMDPLGNSPLCPVWARSKLDALALKEKYGFSREPEIIIVPAFNHLCGGLPLNEPCEDPRGPLLTLADSNKMRLYLLDGTDLGLLSEIKAACKRKSDSKNYYSGTKMNRMEGDTKR